MALGGKRGINEPTDSKQSMEIAMAEAIGLLALGAALAVPSNFKVIGDDRVTLGHDGEKWPAGPDGSSLAYRKPG